MAAWEILAIWFGASVTFTPGIGYFLHASGKMAAPWDATVISLPSRAAVMEDLSRRRARLGASVSPS